MTKRTYCKQCFPNLPDGKWQDNKSEVILTPPKDFSYKESLVYLGRSKDECLYRIHDAKIYKAITLNRENVLIELANNECQNLVIRFVNVIPRKSIRLAIAQYIWEWFDLDTDLTSFYKVAKGDPLLGKLTETYYGLRVIGIPDLFEALCWSIIGQQINLTFAYTLKRKFVESFGEQIQHDGVKYWLFPSPEKVADLSIENLKKLQFSQRKAEYVIETAKQIHSNRLSKLKLETMEFKDAERVLTSIRGIGPWSAHYVLMRCLHLPAAFPIQDVGLHNAIMKQLNLPHKPTLTDIQRLFVPWKNWEAYATFYLWRSLYEKL